MINIGVTSSPPIIGNLYYEKFASSANWTLTGTNDFTYSNKLVISGANTSTYNKFITRDNSNFNIRTFDLEFTLKVKDLSGSSNGFAVGFTSVNTTSTLTTIIEINTQGGVVSPFYKTLGYSVTKYPFSGATNVSCSIDDEIFIRYRVKEEDGKLTISNKTTGAIAEYYIISDVYHNTSKLSVYSLGGTFEIYNLILRATPRKKAQVVFIGDSLTTYYNSFAKMLRTNLQSWFRASGSGDFSSHALSALDNVLLAMPRKAVILLGVNDISNGVSLATYQSNISSIKSQLEAIGTTVKILSIPPIGNANVPTWNSSNASLYGSAFVDIYTSLLGTGTSLSAAYNSGDNVHWNDDGHTVVKNIVKTALGI